MNPRQLEYAILLSEIKNFSQLAEILNISQPALSRQIKTLEDDLGVELFNRHTSPISLTSAGVFFIDEAKELLYKETQLRHALERYKSGEQGLLTIGITPFRCSYLMPEVVKKVREKYPKVQIKLHETSSEQIRKDVCEGKYDFAVVNLPVDDSILDVIPLEADELMLAVPKQMAHTFIKNQSPENGYINFKDCTELPFIVLSKRQEMRHLFNKLCASANIKPNIAAEVVSITTAWSMAQEGIGAALLPLQFMKGTFADDNLILYKVDNYTFSRQPAIVKRKGFVLSEYAEYAIRELLDNNNTL